MKSFLTYYYNVVGRYKHERRRFYKAFSALLLVIALVDWRFFGIYPNYSTGSRAGIITKLSYKGLIWKSWEGSMNIGGTTVDDKGNTVPNNFNFNVDVTNAARINEALVSGKRVELSYRQWMAKPIWIESPYVITEIK